ncbi:DNA binding protein [Streptomyces phage Wofford]|uniref:DNA binding protein n=1 Tax=Streptomyces phage Wofford TaxID=2283267 RepID=A0A345M9U6_9CAUD|nr:single strand DNA binding protein [Streptomyces phage Wollford]AXH67267.1 DNA binding protein [Streptomyces phage Wollford]
MSELKGLDAIRAYKKKMAEQAAEREERAKNAEKPRVKYLRLGVDESVKVRFLQEMDTESRNYDPNRGVGMGAIEHQGIDDNFKYRANCTMDTDSRCWACEKYRAAKKDSKEKQYVQKKMYYINVLVDRGDGNEPEVYILSRSLNSSFVVDLMEEAEEEGSITEKTYKLTRRGAGTDSTYSIREAKNDTTFNSVDFDKLEIFDIEGQVLRKIPYETDYENKIFSQEQFYTQRPGDWKRVFANEDDDSQPATASTQKTEDSATSLEVGW